jgi:hypothetical protein
MEQRRGTPTRKFRQATIKANLTIISFSDAAEHVLLLLMQLDHGGEIMSLTDENRVVKSVSSLYLTPAPLITYVVCRRSVVSAKGLTRLILSKLLTHFTTQFYPSDS